MVDQGFSMPLLIESGKHSLQTFLNMILTLDEVGYQTYVPHCLSKRMVSNHWTHSTRMPLLLACIWTGYDGSQLIHNARPCMALLIFIQIENTYISNIERKVMIIVVLPCTLCCIDSYYNKANSQCYISIWLFL